MIDRRDFRDLYFGKSTAETEVSDNPDRFFNTYYDRWNIKNKFARKDFFLVIGPKGSGKTAVAEYLRISMQRKYGTEAVFSSVKNLTDIAPNLSPITSITSKLVGEQTSGVTDSAWRLYIALEYIELIRRDVSCLLARDARFNDLVKELEQTGLILQDYPTVLRKVREKRFSISLKGFLNGESGATQIDTIPVEKLGASLLDILVNAASENHFLLIIDGLDKIINNNSSYWLTLAGLLRVGADLHRRFLAANSNMRILVMCRSDVIRKIKFADADHIVGDLSVHVDWASQQTIAADSPLWDYLAMKAGISIDSLFNFFPPWVEVGLRSKDNPSRKIPTRNFLISSTRSTPREMTMLMHALQETVRESGYITSDRIRQAVDEFASRNLLTIVTSEATGMLSSELETAIEDVLSDLPCAEGLVRKDFEEALEYAEVKSVPVTELLNFLFMAGLLGNFNTSNEHVQFYHRRDTYKFNKRGPWALHRGLVYAYNIPWTRPR